MINKYSWCNFSSFVFNFFSVIIEHSCFQVFAGIETLVGMKQDISKGLVHNFVTQIVSVSDLELSPFWAVMRTKHHSN